MQAGSFTLAMGDIGDSPHANQGKGLDKYGCRRNAVYIKVPIDGYKFSGLRGNTDTRHRRLHATEQIGRMESGELRTQEGRHFSDTEATIMHNLGHKR